MGTSEGGTQVKDDCNSVGQGHGQGKGNRVLVTTCLAGGSGVQVKWTKLRERLTWETVGEVMAQWTKASAALPGELQPQGSHAGERENITSQLSSDLHIVL